MSDDLKLLTIKFEPVIIQMLTDEQRDEISRLVNETILHYFRGLGLSIVYGEVLKALEERK